jgi:hypothetical protein
MILTPGFVDREFSSTMGVEPIDSMRLCPFIGASSVWDVATIKDASFRVKWEGGIRRDICVYDLKRIMDVLQLLRKIQKGPAEYICKPFVFHR